MGKKPRQRQPIKRDATDVEQDFSDAEHTIKTRQFIRRPPKKVANIVGQLIAKRGIAQQQSSQQIADVWFELAGNFTKRTRPGNIKRGVLEVFVANSMVSQQLSFKKQSILKKLQDQLPQKNIKDISFRIGNI